MAGPPPGAVVTPINQQPSGPPPGAVITPLQAQQPAPAPAPQQPTDAMPPASPDSTPHSWLETAIPAIRAFRQGGVKQVAHEAVERVKGAAEGAEAGVAGATLPAAQALRGTAAGAFMAKHPAVFGLDQLIANDKAAIDTSNHADNEQRGEGHDVGKQIESLAEYELGGEALGKLLPSARFAKYAELAKFVEKHPNIARVLGSVAKNATVAGGQAAVHGESAGDVAEAAAIGGGTAGVMEGAPEAVIQGKRLLHDAIAPSAREIEGVSIPTLASQNPEAGGMARSAATIGSEPEMQQAQQQGAAKVYKNIAQRAAKVHLDNVNEGRTPSPVITDPARQLPAPAGTPRPTAGQYQFTISAGDPVETRMGNISPDTKRNLNSIQRRTVETSPAVPGGSPEEISQGIRQENARAAVGSTAATVPDRMMPRNPVVQELGTNAISAEPALRARSINVDEPIYTLHPEEGEAGSTVQGGGGVIKTSDPAVARAQLSQMENLADSPTFDKLSPRQQQQMTDGITSLRSQLDEYHGKQPTFAPVDVDGAVKQISNFNDLKGQLEGSVQGVYKQLDNVSAGRFGTLREQEKNASAMMRRATTPEAVDTAQARRDQARAGMEEIFKQRPDQVTKADWQKAQQTWRMAATAGDLHDTLESSFNGVSPEIAERTGIQRQQAGGTKAFKRLNSLLDQRGDDLKNLIGQDGVDNLYRVADLLKTPKSAQGVEKLLRGVAMVARRHGTGLGAIAGGVMAHGAGAVFGHAFPAYYGMLAGAGGEAMYRKVVNRVATDPEFASRLVGAVKQGVNTRIAAPLLATIMLQQPQTDSQENKNE